MPQLLAYFIMDTIHLFQRNHWLGYSLLALLAIICVVQVAREYNRKSWFWRK